MESAAFAALSRGESLPLPSLRLLVPPLQLMMASMWQVLRKQDVLTYWTVAEYVSLVVDTVPDLLMHKHRLQLLLGLRARYILELCRNEQLIDHDLISSHLEKIKSCPPATDEPDIVDAFLELIQALLKDPEARQNFFAKVLPIEFGTRYDNDLQMLFAEFVFRLNQLLPVPDMEQTVSWLGNEDSLLEGCERSVSEPADLIHLLQHHKNQGHFEQHVPPSGMGDGILSSLSSSRPMHSDPPQGLSDDEPHIVQFVEDVAVEVVTVTDYSEVELSTSADKEEEAEKEAARGENRGSNVGSLADETVAVLPDEPVEDGGGVEEEEEEEVEEVTPCLRAVIPPERSQESPRREVSPGPHDCPHCKKKFKFASSLTAHRVIHTGERPHCCGQCGRRFSFRQSLDRHRHTHARAHETGCEHRCVCGEAFRSLSAYSQHQQKHGEEDQQKIRTDDDDDDDDDPNANRTSGSPARGREAARGAHLGEVARLDGEERSAGVTPAKVRTSGRKRKPTMKIQVLNLEKGAQRGKKSGKTLTADCAEHSYGSSTPSTHSSESSSAAFSCEKRSSDPSEELRVPRDDTKVHAETKDKKTGFSCPDCEKSFRFGSHLRAHRRVHMGERPFVCAQCGCSFSFKQSLERHKLTHDSSACSYGCPVCGRFFSSLAALKEHGDAHIGERAEHLCSQCGRAFAWKSTLARHAKTHGREADAPEASCKKCPHCELVFRSASHLSRHLRTHRGRTHACSCGKSFSYRGALTAHQRTHQKERPHVCAQCGKGFLYRGGLLSHMKIHSSEMPFMCSFCGKSFKRERNMKKHERCHTGENVFRCSQCDKSFVYKATLIRHELTHSGERPFLCSDCGKGFFSHAELLKHERFHTGHKPFQCPDCGKRFTQSCYLTIHLRYHTGARPYSCAQCDKRFLSANRLKRHQRIHTGEKPYLCVECGKGFRQSYNLKMHQRTHVMKLA